MKTSRIKLFCGLVMLMTLGCEEGASSSDDQGTTQPETTKCTAPETNCGDVCVNLDTLHWSSCDVCAEGYEDKDGQTSNGCESVKENADNSDTGCESNEIRCGEACVNLDEMHWASCGVCAEGYVDADGVSDNGCESAASGAGCTEGSVPCGDTCVNLDEMHWASCGVCAEGYTDADGDAANGCEASSEAPEPECTDGLVKCQSSCVDLNALHWASCGVCAEGYADADGDAANGCESSSLPIGQCHEDKDCAGLLNVSQASCQSGLCVISACADGHADCDKDVANGCEVNGSKDFYQCGAKGLCVADEDKGSRCKLGEQCADGTCQPVPAIVGCSDGTREGFIDLIRFNNLAACGGAWTIPGIHHNVPACDRKSGNTGTNKEGTGCNLEDLCAEGWHVCLGRGDVMTRSDYGCNGIMDGVNQNEPALFITRTSSTGNLQCDPDTVGVPLNMNDIFGCGNFGCYATGSDCDPLKLSSHNLCDALRQSCGCSLHSDGTVKCTSTTGYCYGNGIGHSLDYFAALNNKTYKPAWDCGNDKEGEQEARDIVKSLPDQQGGVMCCKDQCQADADCGVGLICGYHVCVECIRMADGTYEGCPEGKQCTQQHTCE